MFTRQPSETHFIIVTFILVILLGVPTVRTLTEMDIKAETMEGTRAPASVPESVAAVAPSSLTEKTDFDLSCLKKNATAFTVRGDFVQLHGKSCLKDFKNTDVEIINKSNGYTASIFIRGSDKYQTDLIQLNKGENEIAVRYRVRSGKTVEEVIRIRSSQI
ncbi:MAG: hypothetical protein AAGB31_03630 [Bdellovibrio sp.]